MGIEVRELLAEGRVAALRWDMRLDLPGCIRKVHEG